MHTLVEYTNLTLALDNQALSEICKKKIYIANPNFGDLNKLICEAMSGVTAGCRFPC